MSTGMDMGDGEMEEAGAASRWMMALGQLWVLVWKDVMIDLRRKENILAMFFFALLTLLIFNFALQQAGTEGNEPHRVTALALEQLAADGVRPQTLVELKRLGGRLIPGRQAMLRALDKLPGGVTPDERIAVLGRTKSGFLRESAGGLLWVTLLMAGVLGLSRSFVQEREQGCMEGLLLTPVSRGWLYLGKMLSNTLFLVLILLMLLPLFAMFFGVQLQGAWLALVLVLLAGVVGFAALGTLLGGITASLKGREVLLPVLLFPLLVPLVVVGVHLTGVILEGAPLSEQGQWINLLAAFDGIYLVLSYLVFDYVMET